MMGMTGDGMMRAQVLTGFGEADNFQEQTLPIPVPGPGQVLVRLHATSLNPVDIKIRRGLPIAPEAPVILGSDIAGTIVSRGEGVRDFDVGEEVYGCGGGVRGMGGTLAEYIAVDVRLIAPKPRSLTMREAAALPLVSITAWEACEKTSLSEKDRVLVLGGLGGVGHIVIQLAKARGAHVTATVSSEAAASVTRELGADATVNYRAESVHDYVERLTGGRGFSVVIDTVGGDNLLNAFTAAATGGRIATTNARTTQDLSLLHAKALSLHGVFVLLPLLTGEGRPYHQKVLRKIAVLAEQKALRPLIDKTQFSMREIASAHRYFEAGQVRGKLVLNTIQM
jgi:NADPH2:quinone reductase